MNAANEVGRRLAFGGWIVLGGFALAAAAVPVGGIDWSHLSSTAGELPAPDVGRQVESLILDIDKDGTNDFAIAGYEKMAWFRRDKAAGTWTRYALEDGLPTGSLEAGGDAFDIDGDGDLDLVMGAGYGGKGCLWWWENPCPTFDPKTPWKRHLALQVGGQHHDQIFGDFDGDGRLDILQKDFQKDRRVDVWLHRGPARRGQARAASAAP